LPDRLSTVFGFDAAATMGNPQLAAELNEPNAAAVVRALAIDLAAAPRLLDKETFRAAANRVKDQTGQKGKALFHPIRVVLTGAAEGPELDLIVPAIDRAAELGSDSGFVKVVGCRERAATAAGRLR
jgi:glutamyl/glutaminyl-tRNA synthetase